MASRIDPFVLERVPVSGLYVRRDAIPDEANGLKAVVTDTVRLDVDGEEPLNLASGHYLPYGILSWGGSVEWIATLTALGDGVWEGQVIRVFPQNSPLLALDTKVRIGVSGAILAQARSLDLRFGEGASAVHMTLKFESPYFRSAEFEFDRVTNAPMATWIATDDHPERPKGLPKTLTVREVYSRAGIEVEYSPDRDTLGLENGPGAEIWDEQQLHDSMRVFWSRYKPGAQWAAWVLFAHRFRETEVNGRTTVTFGMMFDHGTVKPNDGIQRQGCGIFGETIADLAAKDKHPVAALKRSLFFATVHETGHCFNLLHSFEKELGKPWDPLDNVPDSLTFMNYPDRVTDFWANFRYRFDEGELTFIRHAPEEFVKMGRAAAAMDHGLAGIGAGAGGALRLEAKVAPPRALFQFMEPVRLELKLTNTSSRPLLVDPELLEDHHRLRILARRSGGPASAWRPYVRYCRFSEPIVLHPGQTLARSALVSAGLDGWLIAEPGTYSLETSLMTAGGPIVAEPLGIRVAHPRSHDDELVAQDYFSDEVGRALALGGTRVMVGAIAALREVAERFGDQPAARHAAVALGLPLMRDSKCLRVPEGEASMAGGDCDERSFELLRADPDEARRLLDPVLSRDDPVSARTFGPIEHARLRRLYGEWLEGGDDCAVGATVRSS